MILLVGASSGLAQQLVPQLLQLDTVLATYNTHRLTLEQPEVEQRQLDLGRADAVMQFGAEIAKRTDTVTFINMAAVSPDGLAVRLSEADWRAAFDINVHASFLLLQQLLPKMIGDRWGRVILVSSIVADIGPIGTAAYSATKAALGGLCRTLAHEYGRFNITSNLLVLGYFDRGLIETLSDDQRRAVLQRIPSGRLGNTTDLVQTVRYIRETSYLNGAAIRLDGGFA